MNYDEFRAQYENQHPASVPRRVEEVSPYPRWLQAATLLMFISSALLSGVHTVPVVQQGFPGSVSQEVADLAGLAAFIGVEMAILLSAFALIGGGGKLVKSVLVLSVGTALVANVYSVVNAFQETDGGDWGALAVAVFIGIAAPSIAGLSGKLFVDMLRAGRAIGRRADDAYQKALQKWDSEINREWKKVLKTSNSESNLESELDPRQRLVQHHSRPSARVRQYYRENPEAVEVEDPQDIAAKLNVSRSTVYSVRSRVSQNGNGG